MLESESINSEGYPLVMANRRAFVSSLLISPVSIVEPMSSEALGRDIFP